MKIKRVLIPISSIVIFLVITLQNISCKTCKVKEDKDLIHIELISGKYNIEKTEDGMAQIQIKDFDQTLNPGDPILPFKVVECAVPVNTDMKTIKLKYNVFYRNISEKLDIKPAPPYRARIGKKELVNWNNKPISNRRNIKIYNIDSFYPLDPVRITSKSQMRKWKFVRVAFYPIQYNPVQRKIRQAKKIAISIEYKTVPISAELRNRLLKDTVMDEEAKTRFVNFSEASKWYYLKNQKDLLPSNVPGYVIITTNNIVAGLGTELTDFINSKTNHGYQVSVITENQYGSMTGQSPNQIPDKIRKWLAGNYLDQHIKYALLIGGPDPDDQESTADDIGDIPMKQCWPNRFSASDRDSPTDYYYANLTGDWDLDSDGHFGEIEFADNEESPDPAISPTTFSIRWKGKIMAESNGLFKFLCCSNDGVWIKIDGNPVISDLIPHYFSGKTGNINLTEGLHDIEIDYINIDKGAFISLFRSTPTNSDFNFVTSDILYHFSNGNYISGGLDGEYFDNEYFLNPILNRVDPYIYFNGIRGDQGDGGVDFTPDVYIGRIPIYNADFDSTKAILNKIITYENENPIPAWRMKVLLPMKPSDGETPGYDLGENIMNFAAVPMGFEYFRIYEENYGLTPPPEKIPCTIDNVVANWKNAYGLVTWWTHGDQFNASNIFSIANCNDLDDSKPSFTYQCSCSNGMPEESNNLGYSLLKHGAVSTISASRVSWYVPGIIPPSPSSGINQHLAYYYSKRFMEGQRSGDALYQTKSLSGLWMNNMDFNIYGDPSGYLFEAPDLTVVSKSWSISGEQYVINIMIKNIGKANSGEALIYINAIDPTPPPGVNSIRIQVHETLPPLLKGEEYAFTINMDLAQIHAREVSYIEVLVDAKNYVKESDESNNREEWNWDEGI